MWRAVLLTLVLALGVAVGGASAEERISAEVRATRLLDEAEILEEEDQADAEAITGFIRNAVTVVGARAPLPIYLSHHIAELSSGHFWLGGGAVRRHHPPPRASL